MKRLPDIDMPPLQGSPVFRGASLGRESISVNLNGTSKHRLRQAMRLRNDAAIRAGGAGIPKDCRHPFRQSSVYHFPGWKTASSRWLSAATPPESNGEMGFHPGGMADRPRDLPAGTATGSGIPSGCDSLFGIDRWCRCAQPPATGCEASSFNSGTAKDLNMAKFRPGTQCFAESATASPTGGWNVRDARPRWGPTRDRKVLRLPAARPCLKHWPNNQ
jgi:hypothetical protein